MWLGEKDVLTLFAGAIMTHDLCDTLGVNDVYDGCAQDIWYYWLANALCLNVIERNTVVNHVLWTIVYNNWYFGS